MSLCGNSGLHKEEKMTIETLVIEVGGTFMFYMILRKQIRWLNFSVWLQVLPDTKVRLLKSKYPPGSRKH